MRYNRLIISTAFFCFLCHASLPSFGQLGFNPDIKKPKPYEDRVLRSEKSDQKKLKGAKRLMQNTATHYNYYFNAKNKLNNVIAAAKATHLDDYSQLLPFYNFSLDATAMSRTELDSIIIKAQTGLVLHDLRSDWADDMYLLWGAAYYLRKDFDSAHQMFQFINYAFADKEKDGYYRYIGSRMDGNNALSISTKEKNSLPKKLFSEPPSRNDAFIWQVRTFIAQGAYTEAASLIEALKNDPAFPNRLNNDLEEVQAYWFYTQKNWDSAAAHLSKALSNATNKQEEARWEYLIGQLYERSARLNEAEKYYSKAIGHTTDPVLEIFARLSAIKTNTDSSTNLVDRNIAELMKMAKRDKYTDYRDIIYYMAAQMELSRNNTNAAYALLFKGTSYANANNAMRNKLFLQLAEMAFDKRFYKEAYNFYDSLNLADPSLKNPQDISSRKTLLAKFATQMDIINRQDSLQKIAGLPEADRNDYIKKLVKQYRRLQGLKDDGTAYSPGFALATNNPADIFGGNEKGDWYFYNTSLRTKGAIEFKSRWGNRPNADNWRRSSLLMAKSEGPVTTGNKVDTAKTTAAISNEVSFETLLANLPLTEEKLKLSNDSLQNALFVLGKLYLEELQDCNAMTDVFETLRNRFSAFPKMDEVLFDLYYCTNKSGNASKASQLKSDLTKQYPNSNFTTIATTGKNPLNKATNEEATKLYEGIYDAFIAGNFTEALDAKKKADSIYGQSYWTPQQLYIEAVYYIKERQDSAAIAVLKTIQQQHKSSPLAAKATNLISVLSRRSQIEEELRNLQVERPAEDIVMTDTVSIKTPVIRDSAITKIDAPKKEVTKPVTINRDTTVAARPAVQPEGVYTFAPEQKHLVMLVLNKVDPVFVNEAKTAMFRFNREKYYSRTLEQNIIPLDADIKLLIIGPFDNAKDAADYVQKAKPLTSTEIMPWLKGDKYSYTIISGTNLELLKSKANIGDYKKFLDQHLPGLF